MITKEQFIKLIKEYQEWEARMDKIYEALNTPNLYEADWVQYTSELLETLINLEFNEQGVNDINWWLFEKHEGPCMWDSEGNVIPTDTIFDLWNIVKDNRK